MPIALQEVASSCKFLQNFYFILMQHLFYLTCAAKVRQLQLSFTLKIQYGLLMLPKHPETGDSLKPPVKKHHTNEDRAHK